MSQMTQTDRMFVRQAAIQARKSANAYRTLMVRTDLTNEELAFLSKSVAHLEKVARANWKHLKTMWA